MGYLIFGQAPSSRERAALGQPAVPSIASVSRIRSAGDLVSRRDGRVTLGIDAGGAWETLPPGVPLLFALQQSFQIRKGLVTSPSFLLTCCGHTATRRLIDIACVFIVVTVQAKQLPVATVWGIVVMIVIAVMDCELMQVLPGKLALASPTNPGVHLECLFPVILFPLLPATPGLGDNLLQPVGGFPGLIQWQLRYLRLCLNKGS